MDRQVPREKLVTFEEVADVVSPLDAISDAVQKSHLVRENHQPPISLPAQDPTDTLSSIAHGVEPKKLGFANSIGIPKVLQACL